jgi:hypothetical protein
MPNSVGEILLNSGGQITSRMGTSRSQLAGDRSLDVRPDAAVSAAGRSAIVILLGRTGGFVAAGMHIMLRFTGFGRKASKRRTCVSEQRCVSGRPAALSG